jgi:hypothetical protein
MMEVFDLDFHILTPGGGEEHIMRVADGVLEIVPPAAPVPVGAPAQPAPGK